MGVSRRFYTSLLLNIKGISGGQPFTWAEIMRANPSITKSELTRLKCSGYLVKAKQDKKIITIKWLINPAAFKYMESNLMSVKKKRKRS